MHGNDANATILYELLIVSLHLKLHLSVTKKKRNDKQLARPIAVLHKQVDNQELSRRTLLGAQTLREVRTPVFATNLSCDLFFVKARRLQSDVTKLN